MESRGLPSIDQGIVDAIINDDIDTLNMSHNQDRNPGPFLDECWKLFIRYSAINILQHFAWIPQFANKVEKAKKSKDLRTLRVIHDMMGKFPKAHGVYTTHLGSHIEEHQYLLVKGYHFQTGRVCAWSNKHLRYLFIVGVREISDRYLPDDDCSDLYNLSIKITPFGWLGHHLSVKGCHNIMLYDTVDDSDYRRQFDDRDYAEIYRRFTSAESRVPPIIQGYRFNPQESLLHLWLPWLYLTIATHTVENVDDLFLVAIRSGDRQLIRMLKEYNLHPSENIMSNIRQLFG